MSDFLYPFIDSQERDAGPLLADLARSAHEKFRASAALRATALEACGVTLSRAAAAIASRVKCGGRLFCFGNGGSATDAASLAGLFANPPSGAAIAARTLVDDTAIVTALGNDVGFDLVYSRQIMAHGRATDIAVGMSTSGNSRNVLTAFAVARERGLLTVGFSGYGGGAMVASGDIDHLLVVDADSVHRIQETQSALGFELWRRVQALLSTGQQQDTETQHVG